MSKFLGAATLAAGLLAGTALPALADAATGTGAGTSSSPFVTTGMDSGTQYTIAFPTSGTQSVTGSSKGFTYDFFFSLSSPAILDGITASASSTFKHQPNVTFSNFNLVGVTSVDVATVNGTATYFPQTDYTLAAGQTYELIVSGTTTFVPASGKKPGYYTSGSFNGNLSVSAVPLPTSVAMFGMGVLGLGAFGLVRRKKAVSASA